MIVVGIFVVIAVVLVAGTIGLVHLGFQAADHPHDAVVRATRWAPSGTVYQSDRLCLSHFVSAPGLGSNANREVHRRLDAAAARRWQELGRLTRLP